MDPPRSRLPSPRALAIGALVVAVPGVPWLHARSQRLEVEHRAAAVASTLTGRRVRVDCPGTFARHFLYGFHAGEVRFEADGVPGNETKLDARTCDGLRTVIEHGSTLDFGCLAAGCDDRIVKAAQGLIVLTHETMHLRGTTNEALAECQAHLHVAGVAEQLGVRPADAQDVATWEVDTYDSLLPTSYQGGTC